MRLLHTSDWHLGHRLHGATRTQEHERFLDWLLDRLDEHRCDALLIAGDVFDAANPPTAALEQWYGFLRRARGRLPDLDIVVIGGNHDSAARLEAPLPLLRAIDVHLVGGLGGPTAIDDERLLAPLADADGRIGAWVAAVPFLRPADLPRVDEGDALIDGVRAVYDRVLERAREQAGTDAAVIAMGHCYMTGTTLSELSERRILGGNQHALPHDLFPDWVAYGALGHLHLAQPVGRDSIRYSGSPIPLSMGERRYEHQVLLVELEGTSCTSITPLLVPRSVDFLRVPDEGAAPLDEVLSALAELDVGGADDADDRPFLEVAVRLDEPEPALRRRVEEALEGRPVRLARIVTEYTGDGRALGEGEEPRALGDRSVHDVFADAWRRSHEDDPPEPVRLAFSELVDAVRADEDSA